MGPATARNTQESQEGGNLFKGMRIWVSRRVTARPTVMRQITENGGTLMTRERDADFLIADHVRQDLAPAGALSWLFITLSVKKCRLENLDDHRICRDPAVAVSRPAVASSSHLAKIIRTPFTPEDDAVLLHFILPRRHAAGRKAFQDLEAKHPHHPWQSWRNRWVNRFKDLPMSKLTRYRGDVAQRIKKEAEPAADAAPPDAEPDAGPTLPSTHLVVEITRRSASIITRDQSAGLDAASEGDGSDSNSNRNDNINHGHATPQSNIGPSPPRPRRHSPERSPLTSARKKPRLSRDDEIPQTPDRLDSVHRSVSPDRPSHSQNSIHIADDSSAYSPSHQLNLEARSGLAGPAAAEDEEYDITDDRSECPVLLRHDRRSADERNRQDIQDAVARFEARGYSACTAVEGLHRTSMVPGSAALLTMDRLHRGISVGSRTRGVWPDEDDDALRNGRAPDLLALRRKHGVAKVKLREAYLAAFDATTDALTKQAGREQSVVL